MGGLTDTAQSLTSTIIGGPLGTAADLFKKGKKALTPQLPEIPKPITMPTIDDAAVQAAKRRSILEQISRRGRASTILTSQTDKLGG